QGRVLTRVKLGADFEDAVVEGLPREERGRERAASSTGLEDRVVELCELARERAAEEGAELRCGDEVALAPELLRAARVIPEARLVEGELHVAGERKPTPRGGHPFPRAMEHA